MIILISGHCPKGGVDIWAEEIAKELGIQTEIHPAEHKGWKDAVKCQICGEEYEYPINWETFCHSGETRHLKGYCSRNIEMAESGDIGYCIVPRSDTSYSRELWYCRHCGIHGHPTNGGCWTIKKMKEMGKEVHLVVIN